MLSQRSVMLYSDERVVSKSRLKASEIRKRSGKSHAWPFVQCDGLPHPSTATARRHYTRKALLGNSPLRCMIKLLTVTRFSCESL